MQAMGGPILTNSASYDVLKRKQLPFWDAPALKVLVVLIFTLPVAAVANYCDEYVCLSICLFVCRSVCLSVHDDISGTTRAIFPKSFMHVAYIRGSVLLQHASPIAGKGFSSPLKMHYRLGKGDGSAQCGRSMLSMIALF